MTVYKMTEVVGTSQTSVSDAIQGAIERASATIDDLQWFEVSEIRGRVTGAKEIEYQVRMNIGFTLHAPSKATGSKQAGAERNPTTRAARSTAAQIAAKKGEKRRTDLARSFNKQRSR